jgi:hypothetical protein
MSFVNHREPAYYLTVVKFLFAIGQRGIIPVLRFLEEISMRGIWSVATAVLALSTGIAQAEIKVTPEETQYFMSIVNDLQPQLRAASRGLYEPQRVKEFRDLARILELHSRVIGILEPESRTAADSFAGYLWAANPWVNRNLGIANHGGGDEQLFDKMFATLASHSDEEISQDGKLKGTLIAAAQAIDEASILETAATSPPQATLINEELDLAASLASLGLNTLPDQIQRAWKSENFPATLIQRLEYFSFFLHRLSQLDGPRLAALAKKSAIVQRALQAARQEDFRNAVYRLQRFAETQVGDQTSTDRTSLQHALEDLEKVQQVLKAVQPEPTVSSPNSDVASADIEPIMGFDPGNSIHVAVLTSQLLVELLRQLPKAAGSIKLTQDYSSFPATHPGVAEARMITYALIHGALHLHRHGVEPFTSAIYASNRYSMSGLHHSILVPGRTVLGEHSNFTRLEKALRSAGDDDIPKIVQFSREIGSYADGGFVKLSADPRTKLTKDDTELALLLATTYLRAVPQALRRSREALLQSPSAADQIAHYTHMLSNCVALIGHYSTALESYQTRLLSERAGYPFLPFSTSFPILKIAANAEQVRTDLFGVRTQIFSVGGQINQLIRITHTGRPRTPAGKECAWDIIDTMLDLPPDTE